MTHVTKSGPLFDGRADLVVQVATEDIANEVSIEGMGLIRSDLWRVIRTHPTGQYIRHVQTIKVGSGRDINLGGLIYGPWIEGTSSRNATTRFKGYSTFRRMRQEIDAKAEEIGNRTMARHMGGLN
jgi:hypothetical protein